MTNSRVNMLLDRPGPGYARRIGGGRRRPSRLLQYLLPALLVLVSATAAANGPSLFTTPEQRDRLDRVRAEATAEELAREPEPEPEPTPQAKAEPKPLPRVHLRGFVRRSGGPEAVWVNEGSTLSGSKFGEGITAGRIEGSSVVVSLPDGRRVRLKPGQTWDPARRAVVDLDEQ